MRASIVLMFITALVTVPVASPPQAGRPAPIFVFHNAFWPNLHHFLCVLGRASGKASDAGRRAVVGAPQDQPSSPLTTGEREAWEAAITFYRDGLSKKDSVRDKELFGVTREFALAADAPTLDGRAIDPTLRAAIERAAPVYRSRWWPRHRAANEARIAEIAALLDKHGPAVRDQLTRAYAQPWPAEGLVVEMCAYANWAGAYSTEGPLLVVSSLDSGNAGAFGLEVVFHEAMHQWDDAVFEALRAAAIRQQTRFGPGLSHAMIFDTAGDAVRRVIPNYVTYAEANGMWKSGSFAPFKTAIDRAWRPWLDGKGTMDAALDALVRVPERFTVRLDTSRGEIVIAVERALAPLGTDRFYTLVRDGYFDEARFFRVVAGRWAQFGIHRDPKVSQAWRTRTFPDDPRVASNTRGAVAFAWAVPNGRTTQVFISLTDNSATLDPQGFAPFGRVVKGMEVADLLYSGYGEESGGGIRLGKQDPLFELGNAYLLERYPKLDYIRRATIEEP